MKKFKIKFVSPQGDYAILFAFGEQDCFLHISDVYDVRNIRNNNVFSLAKKLGLEVLGDIEKTSKGPKMKNATLITPYGVGAVRSGSSMTNTGTFSLPCNRKGEYILPIGRIEKGYKSKRAYLYLIDPEGVVIHIEKEKGILSTPWVEDCRTGDFVPYKKINEKILSLVGQKCSRGVFPEDMISLQEGEQLVEF